MTQLWVCFFMRFTAVRWLAPKGWWDGNIAHFLRMQLMLHGEAGQPEWRGAGERSAKIKQACVTALPVPNPRHLIAAIAMPNIGNVFDAGLEKLFERRCLIIGLALERFRLQHGKYPESLAAVREELALFKVHDPVTQDQPLKYRRESRGYVLWGRGIDENDDGGAVETDMVWRIAHNG